MKTLHSRADLLKVIAKAPDNTLNAVIEGLGYQKHITVKDRQEEDDKSQQSPKNTDFDKAVHLDDSKDNRETFLLDPVPFWILTAYAWTGSSDNNIKPTIQKNWRILSEKTPEPLPIATWAELLPKVRQSLAQQRAMKAPDVKHIIQRLTRGEALEKLPQKQRRSWPMHLHILEDRAERLIPLAYDQTYIFDALSRLIPSAGIKVTRLDNGPDNPPLLEDLPNYHGANPVSTILALSDLGVLDSHKYSSMDAWRRFARKHRAEGGVCIALTPAPVSAYPQDFKDLWHLVPWETNRPCVSWDKDIRREDAERLLGMLSTVPKIPPGLLRDVRRTLTQLSVTAECDLWCLPEIMIANPGAAVASEKGKKRLKEHFRALSKAQKKQLIDMVNEWYAKDQEDSLYYETIIALGSLAYDKDIVAPENFDAALNFVRLMAGAFEDKRTENYGLSSQMVEQYVEGFRARTNDKAQNFDEIKQVYSQMCDRMEKMGMRGGYASGADPAVLHSVSPDTNPVKMTLFQRAGQVVATSEKTSSGSPLAQITTKNREFFIWEKSFWASDKPPSWATNWGHDTYGPWAELTVYNSAGQQIVQSLRWISPGSFTMGSPEDEEGRYEDEGPQHKVTLTKGYWLFDTPVTQALWEAVMGNNPSYFKSPERPVESVSYDDAQDFLNKINQRFEGLDLSLPTEAQWEYACRAGSELATYAGAMEIEGKHNAPVLDNIAWYGGNSGVDFDLDEGYDSSDWSEKQYDHKKAGTRSVGLKQANSWGLYDMLGNVLEWCHDDRRNYTDTAETDPVGSLESQSRALRGGSWINDARNVRSASRFQGDRDSRGYGTGFRCARVRAGAEPIGLGRGEAERTTATEPIGGAEKFETGEDTGEKSAKIPASPFVIRSDCEILEFSQISKPDWAEAIGRDPYGVWTDIAIGDVKQRLRWIGPGKFEMGSPEDEAGRYDEDTGYNEGPQHKVTLTKGYWLFDTPVTQALWEAVMGDNPSRFKSPLRPVERISWDEVQDFLKKINTISGFDLTLPTEAQWEYACRAGSELATYAGAMDIKGECNAPVLDEIAWYGGNSGVDFDLYDGVDSSDWPKKQYDHKNAGTRIVGLKQANSWGLFDMLGNVWEWCRDDMRDYKDSAETDPIGSLESKQRALRGGSWDSSARNVRSALRVQDDRDDRYDFLGFRCARVRE